MPRKKLNTDAHKRAVLKYDAANTKQFHLKLNTKTDADIIQRFQVVGSVQTYLKKLVREDMKKDV